MRYFIVFIISFLIALSAYAAGERTILIKNVTVISPDNPHMRPASSVIIRDGRILEVAQGFLSPLYTIDREIDGSGKYLTPGLIDSHVHLMSDAGLREDHAAANPELVEIFKNQEPLSYLYYGFTTLVDLSQSDARAKKWHDQPLRPDMVYCQRLNLVNGYGMAFLPEERKFDDRFFIYNPGQEGEIPDHIDTADHTPEAVMRKIAGTGARCVKTFYEDGFGGLWDWPTPSDDLITRINELAGEMGLVHIHHGNTLSAYKQGKNTRVDIMAHGLWHWEELNGTTERDGELPQEIKALLDQMIKNGTKFQMTAEVLEGEIRVQDEGYLSRDIEIIHSLPEALIKWHNSEEGGWLRRVMQNRIKNNPDIVRKFLGRDWHGDYAEASELGLKRIELIARYIHDRGGILLMGSDAPSSPTYANPPGLNSYLEMLYLEKIGIPRDVIIKSATMSNADAFGFGYEVGTITPGKRADLLLLNSNPLWNISAFNDIEYVIKSGEVIDRKTLSAVMAY